MLCYNCIANVTSRDTYVLIDFRSAKEICVDSDLWSHRAQLSSAEPSRCCPVPATRVLFSSSLQNATSQPRERKKNSKQKCRLLKTNKICRRRCRCRRRRRHRRRRRRVSRRPSDDDKPPARVLVLRAGTGQAFWAFWGFSQLILSHSLHLENFKIWTLSVCLIFPQSYLTLWSLDKTFAWTQAQEVDGPLSSSLCPSPALWFSQPLRRFWAFENVGVLSHLLDLDVPRPSGLHSPLPALKDLRVLRQDHLPQLVLRDHRDASDTSR